MGDVARRSRRVTERDIELFTELTGDRNPLHYDEEAASRSRLCGTCHAELVTRLRRFVWPMTP